MTKLVDGIPMYRHPMHGRWRSMVARCHDPKGPSYHDYGGRGITVCEAWRSSLARFVSDMGPMPSPKMTIDRIDNDGGYWCGKCDECLANGRPSNCRWATGSMQVQNQHRAIPRVILPGQRVSSGPTQTDESRRAAGRTRMPSVWLSAEAEARRAAFAERRGSTRAALEWALLNAPMPPKPTR